MTTVKATPKPGEVVVVNDLPKCDFCDERARYDFKTYMRPWANGCEEHYLATREFTELGVGKGQMLITPNEVEGVLEHDCEMNAALITTDGPLGHGWECRICGRFLQAG